MTRAQFAVTLVVVAIAGFLGGAVSDRMRSGAAYAQDEAASKRVVEAQAFFVVDANGKARAGLGLKADGTPYLALSDSAGKSRAVLGLDADGAPILILMDGAGRKRAGLALLPDGTPGLMLRDEREEGIAFLSGGSKPGPVLSLLDAFGKIRVRIGPDDNGTWRMDLVDAEGKEAALRAPRGAGVHRNPPAGAGDHRQVVGKDDEKGRLLMDDGWWWEVSPEYRITASAWFTGGTKVTVLDSGDPKWPYRLIEGLAGNVIEARPVPE